MEVASLAVSLVALILSAAAIGWQVANHFLTGQRAKVDAIGMNVVDVGAQQIHEPVINFTSAPLGNTQRTDIIKAGKAVLDARATDTGRTLAQEYDPRGMSPGLNAAHRALDKTVDKAFGLARGRTDDHKRLQTLFAYYRDLTTPAP